MVNRGPFNVNKFNDKKCIPSTVDKNKKNWRKNCICYKISFKLCLIVQLSASRLELDQLCVSTSIYGRNQSGFKKAKHLGFLSFILLVFFAILREKCCDPCGK